MDDARRYRVNAADCLLAAKSCQPGYRGIILSVSACWHTLAIQEEAIDLLRSLTEPDDLRNTEPAVKMAGGGIRSKQRLSVHSFRLEVIHAMRTAYPMACEEPPVQGCGR
jgi:hypothetical protein